MGQRYIFTAKALSYLKIEHQLPNNSEHLDKCLLHLMVCDIIRPMGSSKATIVCPSFRRSIARKNNHRRNVKRSFYL